MGAAIAADRLDIVGKMVENGFDVTAQEPFSPILVACALGKQGALDVMLAGKSKEERSGLINKQNKNGHTALYFAALKEHWALVDHLIATYGADTQAVYDGKTVAAYIEENRPKPPKPQPPKTPSMAGQLPFDVALQRADEKLARMDLTDIAHIHVRNLSAKPNKASRTAFEAKYPDKKVHYHLDKGKEVER